MHELLFANRKRLGIRSIATWRFRSGSILSSSSARMEDPVVRQAVFGDIALARQLGVDGTPTMFLDGHHIPAVCQTAAFWQAVAQRPVPSDESD